MSHFIYDLVQSLIIIILCLTIIYPKANKIYRDRKKLRETQREQERKESIHQIVVEFLKELKEDGAAIKGAREGD